MLSSFRSITAGSLRPVAQSYSSLFSSPILTSQLGATRTYAKKKAADSGNKTTSKQVAQQRERALAQQQLKRKELKKMARLRLQAKRSLDTPLYLPTTTALQYLRAIEVGYPADTTTITMTVRVIADRGVQPISGSVKLPKGINTDQRIAVFTLNPELAAAAKQAGAVVVGGEELIEQVKEGNIDFNKALATPDIVSKLTPIARILGPKGLMPSARKGTVSNDIVSLVSTSIGQMDFRQRSVPTVSVPVAKANFSDAEVIRNLIAAIDAVRLSAAKVISKKPVVLGQTTLSTTHGPGIVIDV